MICSPWERMRVHGKALTPYLGKCFIFFLISIFGNALTITTISCHLSCPIYHICVLAERERDANIASLYCAGQARFLYDSQAHNAS